MHSLQTQADDIAAAYFPPDTGRPSHIGDADLLKQLFAAIKDGNYLETACDLVGLSVVTVNNWRKRGEAGEAPYTRFLIALKEASAQAEAQAVANVRKAGQLPQFWAAEMTYLERRHPEKWGRRTDSESAPRVVVQVGGNATDVKVLIQSGINDTFAPLTTTDSLCITQPSGDIGSNNGSYVEYVKSLPTQELAVDTPIPLTTRRVTAQASKSGTQARRPRRKRRVKKIPVPAHGLAEGGVV